MKPAPDTEPAAASSGIGWRVLSWLALALMILLLAAAIVLVGLTIRTHQLAIGRGAEPSEPARAIVVETEPVEPATSFRETLVYTGVVKAARVSDLSFVRAGRVERMFVRPGEVVAAGAVLAELNRDDLIAEQARLEEAKMQIQAANDARAAPDASALQATVRQLRTELAQLRSQLQIPPPNGSPPPNAPPPSSLESRLESIARRIAQLENAVERGPETTPPITSADLQSRLAQIDVELRESSLTAPFAGVVAQVFANDGAVVSPGRPVVRLIERQRLEAWVGVPGERARELEVGHDMALEIDGRQYTGEVAARLPDVDSMTRTRTVVLTLDDVAANEVLPGASVRLELKSETEASGFWLPISALDRDADGLWSVLVVETGDEGVQRAARRLVEIVHTETARALVRGLLDPGERVIARGVHRVVPGQRVAPVSVVEESSSATAEELVSE